MSEKRRRDRVIASRVHDDERDLIQEAADAAGISVSALVRKLTLNAARALRDHQKGEIIAFRGSTGLQWRQVDWEDGAVRLDPGTTKNSEGRTFPFSALPSLEELLRRQRERTKAVERSQGTVVPHVFHRDGDPSSPSGERGRARPSGP